MVCYEQVCVYVCVCVCVCVSACVRACVRACESVWCMYCVMVWYIINEMKLYIFSLSYNECIAF